MKIGLIQIHQYYTMALSYPKFIVDLQSACLTTSLLKIFFVWKSGAQLVYFIFS